MKVVHDDNTNWYSFVTSSKSITHVPLSPSQVYEDQLHLKQKSDEIKNKKKWNGRERKREHTKKNEGDEEKLSKKKMERNMIVYAK